MFYEQVKCETNKCPNNCYPGLWEVPVARLKGPDGEHCVFMSKCLVEADTTLINDTLNRIYNERVNGNRSPLVLNFELEWFERNENAVEGLKK